MQVKAEESRQEDVEIVHFRYECSGKALRSGWLIDKVRIAREVVFNEVFNTFPWWHRGQESASQCWGHRFHPWSGKIPHAAEKLSL